MNWRSRLLSAGLALLAMSPAASALAQTADPAPEYVVQAGDTLYGIARQFGLTVEALQAANPDVAADALPVGGRLRLPGFKGAGGQLAVVSLQAGETLDSLAVRLGVTRDDLVRLNRIVNPGQLFIGQLVVVNAPGAGAQPVPTGETVALQNEDGLLALAAARGLSPWSIAAVNRPADPGRYWPSSRLVVPGGSSALTGLPAPLTDLEVLPLPARQGHTLVVKVATARPGTLGGSLGDWPLTFAPDPDDPAVQVALLGIYRMAEANLYPLSVSLTTEQGRVDFVQALAVRASDFGSDPPLTVDPATLDPVLVKDELDSIRAIASAFSPTRLWSGPFELPSAGGIRSRFGVLRAYNGGPYDAFHAGVDFAGGEETPITAPAPAVVAFTGKLAIRGNTTILNHGWGVFTVYAHQTSIRVQAGQTVEAGELIGLQGATGRVTGPHLHWEVFVGGYQVEPLEWTETAFP